MEVSFSSSVSDVVDEWFSIYAFFMEACCTEDDESLNVFASRLPEVKRSLELIYKALMRERSQVFLTSASQFRTIDRYGVSNFLTGSSLDMSSHKLTQQNCNSNSACVDGGSWLPPCYAFLWSDSACGSLDDACLQTEGATVPVGRTFFLSLCQFAKHNLPPGSRQIIFCFLARVFSELDLPRPPWMGDPTRSLLQLFPNNIAVPLVDMVRQIGAGLRPKTTKRRKGMVETLSTCVAMELDMDVQDDEREAFLTLLCAMAERMEQVPSLAAFFLPAAMMDTEEKIEDRSELNSSLAVESTFSILQEFLAYVTLRQGSAQSVKRNSICHLALRGLLALAKCPNPVIQDYVKKHAVVASLTLTGARTTLLTLCKVPYNDDADAQLMYLGDVLCFWSQLLLLAPAVAAAWQVEELVECSFVRDALIPLFCLTDNTVYSAAALVTAKTVCAVGCASPFYVSVLTRAILGTRVDHTTGNPVRISDADNMSSSSRLVPLLDYALLPHISTPLDGDWRSTVVTLHLLYTLVMYEPVLFMRFTLSLSISSLVDVFKRVSCQNERLNAKVVDGAQLTVDTVATNFSVEETRDVTYSKQLSLVPDLSAAATSPFLDVVECFPERLRASKGVMLSTNEDSIAEEVLARLLLLETHTPVSVIELRQCIINRLCRDMEGDYMNLLLESEECGSTSKEGVSVILNDNDEWESSKNIWFHAGVHQSPLVAKLCDLTSRMLSIPSEVCTLLTQLWTTMCVLPDFRVLYTLMDPKHGRLREALLKLRNTIERELQHDEDVAFALASAAAAVAGRKGAKADMCETVLHDVPLADGKPLLKFVHTTASRLQMRSYLYLQFIERGGSLRWVADAVEKDFPNHELLAALKKHRVFLEACASVEAFRMELSAAVGHVALSHNLMCLQTGMDQVDKKRALN